MMGTLMRGDLPEFTNPIVFDSKCLNDIRGFLDELNRMYKEGEFNK